LRSAPPGWARLPFTGTTLSSLPWPAARSLSRPTRQSKFFNFELHAGALLDASDGTPAELARHQRDLTVRRETKIARLSELFQMIKDDFELTTLADAALRIDFRPNRHGRS